MHVDTTTLDQILVMVASSAGAHLRKEAFTYGSLEWKKKDDPVTELDRFVEQEVKREILKRTDANFIGEEYGLEDHGAQDTYIIDPIDGTKSFITREFISTISIGVERKGALVAGCVYDFMRNILYVGSDNGVFLLHQGRTFYPKSSVLKQVRICIDAEDSSFAQRITQQRDVKLIRPQGSIALALAQTAFGTYDGIVMHNKNKGGVWDIAAGAYLLQATEHELRAIDGNSFDHRKQYNSFAAFHPRIAKRFLDISQSQLAVSQ